MRAVRPAATLSAQRLTFLESRVEWEATPLPSLGCGHQHHPTGGAPPLYPIVSLWQCCVRGSCLRARLRAPTASRCSPARRQRIPIKRTSLVLIAYFEFLYHNYKTIRYLRGCAPFTYHYWHQPSRRFLRPKERRESHTCSS